MLNQQGNSKLVLIIIILVAVVGGLYYSKNKKKTEPTQESAPAAMMEKMDSMEASKDESMMAMDDAMMEKMVMMEYEYSGTLDDVTEGKTIRGITTNGNGSGVAMATFAEGIYSLSATMNNVPDPAGTDFYEGWVVRMEPFDFISTGKLEKKDGKWVDMYSSEQDLTEYDFYVLTLEPDDNDPAPADHIVEGKMSKK